MEHLPITGLAGRATLIRDDELVGYLDHIRALGTGFGLPRRPTRNGRTGNMLPLIEGKNGPLPLASDRGHTFRSTTASLTTITVTDTCFGDPTEITSVVWMRERLRGYVRGWFPEPAPLVTSPFGPDRFRPFSQEPYFPVSEGFISRPLETTTRPNRYRLD